MPVKVNRIMNMKHLCKLNASYMIMHDDILCASADGSAELKVLYKPFTHEMEGLFGTLDLFHDFEQWLDCFFDDTDIQKLVDLKKAQDDFKSICGLIVRVLQQGCNTHQKQQELIIGSLNYETGSTHKFITDTFNLTDF